MKLRTIVLGVVACGLAFVWRWTTASEPEPERLPVAAPRRDARVLNEVARMVRVDRAERIVEPIEEEPTLETENDTVERNVDALFELADTLDERHGAIHGRVVDQNGESLAGVTITASVDDEGVQTAISDENGFYAITLPVSVYVVSFYYLETTAQNMNVEVAGQTLTPIFESIDTSQPWREAAKDIAGVSFSGCTGTVDNVYIVERISGEESE